MANIKDVKPYGYYDKALRQYFPTVISKKEFMKKNGIRHDGSTESETHRVNRIAEEYNEKRRKEGKKTRTVQEIVGDTRRIPTKTYFT